MKTIRYLSITLLLTIYFSVILSAQNEDSVWIRENHIKTRTSKLFLTLFESNKDTCTRSVINYNKDGLIIYNKDNYGCLGYNMVIETTYSYSGIKLVGIEVAMNGELQRTHNFTLDSFNRIVKEKLISFNPYSEDVITTTYYGKPLEEDSLLVQIKGDTTIVEHVTYKTYLQGLLMATSTVPRGKKAPISGSFHDYYSNGKVKKLTVMQYGTDDGNSVLLYEYNDDWKIESTTDDVNNIKTIFYYNNEGLLDNSLGYNKFGELDKKVFYLYDFW